MTTESITFNLKDYFAAKAMAEILAVSDLVKLTEGAPSKFMKPYADAIAEKSFLIAESMMEARTRHSSGENV